MAAILLFTRAPRPGRTKTRLIPALGAEGAARLHRHLLEHLLDQARQVADAQPQLCCDDPCHPYLRELARRHGLPMHQQRGQDLGARMFHALQQVLQRHDKALLVGSDCPQMDAACMRQALDLLGRDCPVVFNPSHDGGYLLIGMTRPIAALFRDISWGSDRVYAESVARLDDLGIRHAALPAKLDLDTPEDLRRGRALLTATGWSPAPRAAQVAAPPCQQTSASDRKLGRAKK
jgi:rSAM/selenodomain-associated transferase 1